MSVTTTLHDERMTYRIRNGVPVWALLVERGVEDGSDLRLFWQRNDAEAAASVYMAERRLDVSSWSPGVDEAIEEYNTDPSTGEHLFLGLIVIEGEQSRCDLCGQPMVIEDEDDPECWVHADDASDGADHTAEPEGLPRPD